MGSSSYDGDDVKIKAVDPVDPSIESELTRTVDGDRRRLDVSAKIIGPSVVVIPFVNTYEQPVINSDTSDIRLNKKNSSFTTIWDISGSGMLYGFSMEFGNKDQNIKLEIDGVEIFTVSCVMLESMFKEAEASHYGWIQYDAGRDIFHFKPKFPFQYLTNITVKGRSTKNSYKYVSNRFIEYTKVSP